MGFCVSLPIIKLVRLDCQLETTGPGRGRRWRFRIGLDAALSVDPQFYWVGN